MLIKNYNASDVIRKNKNRAIYSNLLQQQKLVENGLQLRINYVTGSGGAATNASSDVIPYNEGVYDLTLNERNAVLANVNIPVIPSAPVPAPIVTTGGSMYFNGTDTSNLSIANDIDLRMRTGDFTIEWFQYVLPGTQSFQRIFAIGTYLENNISIAVSQEGSDTSKQFILWPGMSALVVESANYINTWVHFAIVRNGTSLKIYKNGTQIYSAPPNTTDFNNTASVLRIGNESTVTTVAAFNGYITNFRWTKGEALYTANFTRPTAPLTAGANTKLLLLASTSNSIATDSSGLNKTVINTGVTWNSSTPF